MEIKTTKQDITNSPKDLNELWAATSPIYHDDQLTDDESDHDLDVNIAIKAAACRDVTFIIGDYNDIMGKIDCGLRVIRYGIDVRVNADPKIFFDTLGWAVQGNEECQEFLQLYPDSLSYSHIQVCSLLEQIYVAVSEYIKHICLGKQYHQNYNFGYHCHFSFPQPTAFSTPPECMQLYQNQTTNSAHLNGVVGVNTNSAPKPVTNARRKTGRVKNQLREISRAKVVDSSPSVAEYDASAVQVQPMTGMDVARSLPSSSESVVAAANNNQGHAASTMTLSPLIGREEGKSRRKRYKFIHFPGLTGSEPVLAPKGVYKTASGFRVQLNVGSPQSQRKFSRNAPVVHDALWLYEIAILMADSPHELSSMLNNGNYISMKSLKLCDNEVDYNTKLLQNIHHCFEENLLDANERDHALVAHSLLK